MLKLIPVLLTCSASSGCAALVPYQPNDSRFAELGEDAAVQLELVMRRVVDPPLHSAGPGRKTFVMHIALPDLSQAAVLRRFAPRGEIVDSDGNSHVVQLTFAQIVKARIYDNGKLFLHGAADEVVAWIQFQTVKDAKLCADLLLSLKSAQSERVRRFEEARQKKQEEANRRKQEEAKRGKQEEAKRKERTEAKHREREAREIQRQGYSYRFYWRNANDNPFAFTRRDDDLLELRAVTPQKVGQGLVSALTTYLTGKKGYPGMFRSVGNVTGYRASETQKVTLQRVRTSDDGQAVRVSFRVDWLDRFGEPVKLRKSLDGDARKDGNDWRLRIALSALHK